MTTQKTTVIHHSADFDGIFCREIARKFLPNAELIGWDYGNPKLPFPEGQVYVLDLSPECFDMSYSDECNSRLIWIDHHKSAIDRFWSSIPGYRIDGVAACRLAWHWFSCQPEWKSPDTLARKQDFVERIVEEPWAVRLAGEYDIWDKRDPNAELFQHGLRSQNLNAIWGIILQEPTPAMGEKRGLDELTVEALLDQGRCLQFAKTNENETIIKRQGFTFEWEGLTWLACNHASFNSHLFTAGIKPEHDALFGFRFDGKWFSVSLYHAPGKEHHDLSILAVKNGGGGHRGACGFRAKELPFARQADDV